MSCFYCFILWQNTWNINIGKEWLKIPNFAWARSVAMFCACYPSFIWCASPSITHPPNQGCVLPFLSSTDAYQCASSRKKWSDIFLSDSVFLLALAIRLVVFPPFHSLAYSLKSLFSPFVSPLFLCSFSSLFPLLF